MEKLVGHTVANATTKSFESGKSVVNFTIAENRSIPDGAGGFKQVTRYFECSYWISTAIAPYLTKGKLVAIEGIIGARAYVNKQSGEAVAVLTLQAQHINLYSSGQKAGKGNAALNEPVTETGADDLPF
jgi:single-strand DNA-binding protein